MPSARGDPARVLDGVRRRSTSRTAAEASAASCHGQTRIVTPTTSWPASVSSAAATEESTPPLIPTTMRSARHGVSVARPSNPVSRSSSSALA